MQKHAARFNVYQGKFDKDKTMEVRSLSSQESFFAFFFFNYYWSGFNYKSYLCGNNFARKIKSGEFIMQYIESIADIICPD